ncbi:MAG TPA: DUF885 domain-containing protein [Streptosporangiaceae bacterium]|nr:DUF885 domain-containing protein [Streptosporangiaceae bacterium]
MSTDTSTAASPEPRTVRQVADDYVLALVELDPILGTRLGIGSGQDRLPDFSPAGQEAQDELDRSVLADLAAVQAAAAAGAAEAAAEAGGSPQARPAEQDDRRCARLLRERIESELAASRQGSHLCAISNLFGPANRTRSVFLDMPTATQEDWAVIARRMAQVPQSLASYRLSLAQGVSRGLLAGPRVVRTVLGQLADWAAAGDGRGWFADFADGADALGAAPGGPTGSQAPSAALRADLDRAAAAAMAAASELREWLAAEYLPRTENVPDGIGAQRYLVEARRCTGADIDPAEAYSWGWSQYREIEKQMREEAQRVLPGESVPAAMRYLDVHGEAVDGVDEIRNRLQRMMDEAIADLDGTHFDIAGPLRTVEARIAPPGSAAAPYYTAPSQDFSRPGRTWLPTLGRTRFPLWSLVSTWYHEGVPGHHLQLAQWRYLADKLSLYQMGPGAVSACSEGWALYAERLMDELGYLSDPGARIGYLEAQMLRAMRVIVDIGMHLELPIPADSPVGAGQNWTPELAREFFGAHSGREPAFLDSEIIRYLSMPGQAITYKLGERAWLAGRDAAGAAHAARGAKFDLKAWHMAALSLGPLGLDDLTDELAAL